ncbi:MAG: hypothetical protein ACR2LF_13605 [Jatrophihabitantaceae bacterium]
MLRFRRAPKPCPGCGETRVLAFYDDQLRPSCARCAGHESVYGCEDCGREDNPFGRRCGTCELRRRLADLLADTTGGIHPQLRPVFDALMAAPRPQSVLYWLTRSSSRPDLLRAMACGDMAISHAAFDPLPPDRAVIYVRDLLAAVEVLPPYDASVERVTPWLRDLLATLPKQQADLIGRFARWQLLRRLRLLEDRGKVTRGSVQHARGAVLATARFLRWLDDQHVPPAMAGQPQLDRYLVQYPGRGASLNTFLDWTSHTRLTAPLRIPVPDHPLPHVALGDEQRWRHVERLLHDDSVERHVRVAGLFILLFAQPLSRICRMTHEQIASEDGLVTVTFDTEPIEMPDPLDRLVLDQHAHATSDRYATHRSSWLFPGRHAGRPLATENFRSRLVALGIAPNQARKAAMVQLAAEMPAPVLADLLGLAPATASRWAKLAARDWSQYAAMRRNESR